jgi:ankyrin repeat protein
LEVLRLCFPANLRHTLEELPKSLDGTYKRILNEINNANQVHAYRLLKCITVALRPLRVEELAEVLAFDLTAGRIPKLNADWRWEDQEEAVLSACSSLVSVIVDDGSRVVQFSHFSVKEFLTSDRPASCMEEVSQFHIPLEPSHAILARACLGVFLCLDDQTDEDSVEEIPLYRYAAKYWVKHAGFGSVELQIKDTLDYFFDTDNPHFSALAQIEYPEDLLKVSMYDEPTGVPRPAAPLYFSAWMGLRGLVKHLIIRDPQHVTQLGGLYGTPLHASILGGYFEISQLLLEHGADINSRCGDNWTPLHLALNTGQLESTKWLLNHGADVNSKTKGGWAPLHLAGNDLEACRMLLELNAEVNSWDNEGLTPFLRACKYGSNPDILQLFLEHNADVRVCDDKGNTPLHFAAENGNLEAVQILLERDADVNSQNGHKSTPLLLASELGHPDVVQLLLDHNADLSVSDADGDSPLHCAAIGGQLEVARILLKLDVEANSRNEEGSTPLHLASKCREEEEDGSAGVVRLLLEYGADVQARDHSGKTASEVARGPEQQEIVRLLSQPAAE